MESGSHGCDAAADALQESGPSAWRCRRPRTLLHEELPIGRPGCRREFAAGEYNVAALVKLLWEVSEELCPYLLLFIEVSAVGNVSASCTLLRDCLWTNGAFWKVYAGPCLCDELEVLESGQLPVLNSEAAALRERFRKWMFHLDGAWTTDFRNCVDEERRSPFGANFVQLFGDARFVASGLMPYDSRVDLNDFVALLCELLTEYCPAQLDERREAEALVAQVERQDSVFTELQVREIVSAYDRSLENAPLDEYVEDSGFRPDILRDPLQDAEEEEDRLFGDG